MSKRGLLSGSTLAGRFPTVARMLGAATAAEDDDTQTGEDAGGEGEGEGEQTTPPENGETEGGEDGEGGENAGEDEGGEASDATQGGTAATILDLNKPLSSLELLTAFDTDASALVAAERERCIGVFLSDGGKRNPEGSAELLRETDMDATKATKFLATFGNKRTDARGRLQNDPSTRVDTGRGSEAGSGDTDAKSAHRKRQAARNKAVKGGKKVEAESQPATDD